MKEYYKYYSSRQLALLQMIFLRKSISCDVCNVYHVIVYCNYSCLKHAQLTHVVGRGHLYRSTYLGFSMFDDEGEVYLASRVSSGCSQYRLHVFGIKRHVGLCKRSAYFRSGTHSGVPILWDSEKLLGGGGGGGGIFLKLLF